MDIGTDTSKFYNKLLLDTYTYIALVPGTYFLHTIFFVKGTVLVLQYLSRYYNTVLGYGYLALPVQYSTVVQYLYLTWYSSYQVQGIL